MKPDLWIVTVLLAVPFGSAAAIDDAEEAPGAQPSAAELARVVYASEAWIREVDSCLWRVELVQYEPTDRDATAAPSAAEFERYRLQGSWRETGRSRHELAWDRSRVRSTMDYGESGGWMSSAWDGKLLRVHERSPQRNVNCYGLYDDSRKHTLISQLVNLWSFGGLVTNDRNGWWLGPDPAARLRAAYESPEDFRLAGKSTVDGRECHEIESRAAGLRLSIDVVERRVRRITRFHLPNDLDSALYLTAMRKAGGVELASPHDWKRWVASLDEARRAEVERRLAEELFPFKRIGNETFPSDPIRVRPESDAWLPRRYTTISSYPDWDVVEKTGKYTYVVSRTDVVVTEFEVDEPLADADVAIAFEDGIKVYDWRFDPPAEYEHRQGRTEEEIRAIADEARRRHDERTAPYREMVARIEERVGQPAPELPRSGWLDGAPLELAKLRGRAVVLHFWATWCGPCHDDIRQLVAAGTTPDSRPLVIGVHDASADRDIVKKAVADLGIRYPIVIDLASESADGVSQRAWYRVHGFPYTILIDKRGRVAAHGSLGDVLDKARALE